MSADCLADAVRSVLAGAGRVREIKMFGGIGFMLNGNLVVGASKRGLLARVGKQGYREALSRPGARPMVMRGRTMEGYIRVDPQKLDERAVRSWVELAIGFVKTLAPKVSSSRPERKGNEQSIKRRGR